MKKKMQQFGFLIFLFILFFIILNIVIFPLINMSSIENSFIIIFAFWFIMILLLYFISRVHTKNEKEENV